MGLFLVELDEEQGDFGVGGGEEVDFVFEELVLALDDVLLVLVVRDF